MPLGDVFALAAIVLTYLGLPLVINIVATILLPDKYKTPEDVDDLPKKIALAMVIALVVSSLMYLHEDDRKKRMADLGKWSGGSRGVLIVDGRTSQPGVGWDASRLLECLGIPAQDLHRAATVDSFATAALVCNPILVDLDVDSLRVWEERCFNAVAVGATVVFAIPLERDAEDLDGWFRGEVTRNARRWSASGDRPPGKVELPAGLPWFRGTLAPGVSAALRSTDGADMGCLEKRVERGRFLLFGGPEWLDRWMTFRESQEWVLQTTIGRVGMASNGELSLRVEGEYQFLEYPLPRRVSVGRTGPHGSAATLVRMCVIPVFAAKLRAYEDDLLVDRGSGIYELQTRHEAQTPTTSQLSGVRELQLCPLFVAPLEFPFLETTIAANTHPRSDNGVVQVRLPSSPLPASLIGILVSLLGGRPVLRLRKLMDGGSV